PKTCVGAGNQGNLIFEGDFNGSGTPVWDFTTNSSAIVTLGDAGSSPYFSLGIYNQTWGLQSVDGCSGVYKWGNTGVGQPNFYVDCNQPNTLASYSNNDCKTLTCFYDIVNTDSPSTFCGVTA